jgi:hypothetical protein
MSTAAALQELCQRFDGMRINLFVSVRQRLAVIVRQHTGFVDDKTLEADLCDFAGRLRSHGYQTNRQTCDTKSLYSAIENYRRLSLRPVMTPTH